LISFSLGSSLQFIIKKVGQSGALKLGEHPEDHRSHSFNLLPVEKQVKIPKGNSRPSRSLIISL